MMSLKQATPLIWRYCSFRTGSFGLNISLGNYALNAMPGIAPLLPIFIKLRVAEAVLSSFRIDPLPIFPVVPAPTSQLLLQLTTSLFSICSPCLFPAPDAVFLVPLAPTLGVPTAIHLAHFVRIILAPCTSRRTKFARMSLPPSLHQLTMMLPLHGMISQPSLLVLALIGAIASNPLRII
jgi:hypothetical protein